MVNNIDNVWRGSRAAVISLWTDDYYVLRGWSRTIHERLVNYRLSYISAVLLSAFCVSEYSEHE